ncbi:MAG: hypothetical protein H7Y14_10370 [Burkholderiales bacterium]|nr:hypothetical protein [Burkholderiales bacterium]
MSARCHVVELALDALDFPDRLAMLALLKRLPELGTLKCVEIALAPAGGGRLSFVVHDVPDAGELRHDLAALVGDEAIRLCTARPA